MSLISWATELEAPVGNKFDDYHLESAAQDVRFSCLCDVRPGANKSEDPNKLQVFLDLLNDILAISGIRLTSSKCEMLLQYWIVSNPNFALGGGQLGELDKFYYLGDCISPNGLV